jgi:hypothetical protein
MAARRIGVPLPTQRAALDMPVEEFLIPFKTDTLVGKIVKQRRKGFTPILKFRLERQQTERQIGQAKLGAELTQTIL